jgi:hypothetical protein
LKFNFPVLWEASALSAALEHPAHRVATVALALSAA